MQRAGVVIDLVEDPYSRSGAFIEVMRATRDDPLAGMRSRNFIDVAQFRAGRAWQQMWERAEVGSIRAIDPRLEPVDGHGPTPEVITAQRQFAMSQLYVIRVRLGEEGDRIVRAVLGERLQLQAVAQRHGRPAKYMGLRFRECLESMAKHWRLA